MVCASVGVGFEKRAGSFFRVACCKDENCVAYFASRNFQKIKRFCIFSIEYQSSKRKWKASWICVDYNGRDRKIRGGDDVQQILTII